LKVVYPNALFICRSRSRIRSDLGLALIQRRRVRSTEAQYQPTTDVSGAIVPAGRGEIKSLPSWQGGIKLTNFMRGCIACNAVSSCSGDQIALSQAISLLNIAGFLLQSITKGNQSLLAALASTTSVLLIFSTVLTQSLSPLSITFLTGDIHRSK
jgi:hypothetical protein